MGGRGDGPQAVIAEIVTCRTELNIPYAVACRALEVSESWFYKHRDRPPTATVQRRQQLDAAIVEVFTEQDGEYGSPRVHAELVERPEFAKLSVNTVAERMRDKGLKAKKRPVRRSLTRPDKQAPKFENLLQRQFNPPAANVAWCGDITEISTWEGKLYLATVIDLWSRRVIGFAIAEHCKAPLVCDALRMAIAVRGGKVAGVIMHTDRGSQPSSDLTAVLRRQAQPLHLRSLRNERFAVATSVAVLQLFGSATPYSATRADCPCGHGCSTRLGVCHRATCRRYRRCTGGRLFRIESRGDWVSDGLLSDRAAGGRRLGLRHRSCTARAAGRRHRDCTATCARSDGADSDQVVGRRSTNGAGAR